MTRQEIAKVYSNKNPFDALKIKALKTNNVTSDYSQGILTYKTSTPKTLLVKRGNTRQRLSNCPDITLALRAARLAKRS